MTYNSSVSSYTGTAGRFRIRHSSKNSFSFSVWRHGSTEQSPLTLNDAPQPKLLQVTSGSADTGSLPSGVTLENGGTAASAKKLAGRASIPVTRRAGPSSGDTGPKPNQDDGTGEDGDVGGSESELQSHRATSEQQREEGLGDHTANGAVQVNPVIDIREAALFDS